jgi:methionyl-tRNA formyltransferase
MPLRIVFMGTAEIACPSLLALSRADGFQVVAVVTQPDKPGGRHLQLHPSPVKQVALAEQLPVLQPLRARDESFITELRQLQPDLIVVAAYGQILPPAILDLPVHGCLNIHTSLLPKYRGASPIQTALLHDEAETGVTIMKMDAGLDTGPLLASQATPIGHADNAETLHHRLAQIGAELVVQTIPGYLAGKIRPRPQPTEGVSHAAKIKKHDGLLDWQLPARALWNRVRAFVPWPGAFTYLPCREGKRLLKIWKAEVVPLSGPPGQVLRSDKSGVTVACGQDALQVTELQLEGGRRHTAQQFATGHVIFSAQTLG